jgi:hypothetical protein
MAHLLFHPDEEIHPNNGACFQTISNHLDGASQEI